MKLYDSIGPNPQVVRFAAAEKGIVLAKVPVDILAGDNRGGEYMAKNPMGTTPTLELADGTYLTETIAIAEYFEELHPTPALIGASPKQRAETRMWVRRIDLGIVEPMTNGFRAAEGRTMFEPRIMLVRPEGAVDLKAIARAKLLWLDGQMNGRRFICGDRFTLADILLFAFMAFGTSVGQPVPSEAAWLRGWFERVAARPSAAA